MKITHFQKIIGEFSFLTSIMKNSTTFSAYHLRINPFLISHMLLRDHHMPVTWQEEEVSLP